MGLELSEFVEVLENINGRVMEIIKWQGKMPG